MGWTTNLNWWVDPGFLVAINSSTMNRPLQYVERSYFVIDTRMVLLPQLCCRTRNREPETTIVGPCKIGSQEGVHYDKILGGGWTNPSERYAHQIGIISPRVGVKRRNSWNHQLERA